MSCAVLHTEFSAINPRHKISPRNKQLWGHFISEGTIIIIIMMMMVMVIRTNLKQYYLRFDR